MNIKKAGLMLLAGAIIAGCGTKKDEAVIAVNGTNLMRSSIEADVEAVLKAQGERIPEEQKVYVRQQIENQIVQSFIVESVLVAKAKAAGFVVTDADRKARADEFLKAISRMPDAPKTIEEYFKKFPLGEERARKEFENGIIIDKMIKAEQAKAPKVDYEKIAKEELAKAASAEKDALKKITALKAELDKVAKNDLPKKFAELAKANSACPSSQKGGDLGEFTRGMMVKEFDEVAFTLPVNKVSEPVKTQFGYHLVMTTKKVPAVEAKGDTPATPEKVQASHILVRVNADKSGSTLEEVKTNLKARSERDFVSKFVSKAIENAKIEAFDEAFKRFVPKSAEKAADMSDDKPPVEKPAKK